MKRVGAPRKLSPEEEAAFIAWYSEYQRALNDIRRMGSIPQKAKELGVSLRTLHTIPNRHREKVRRCLDPA